MGNGGGEQRHVVETVVLFTLADLLVQHFITRYQPAALFCEHGMPFRLIDYPYFPSYPQQIIFIVDA